MKREMYWVKVSDALPEERESVLIRFWNGVTHSGSRFGNAWHANFNDYPIEYATHWMKIEEPQED